MEKKNMNKKILLSIGLVLVAAIALQSKQYVVVNNLPKDEYFFIKPKGSNLCLGTEKDASYDKLTLTSCSAKNAKWKFHKKGNGMYNIYSIRGGSLGIMDIKKNGSRANKAPSGRDVKFLAHNNDTYFIKFRVSGKVLDVAQSKIRRKGAHIVQWRYNGQANQMWKFVSTKNGRPFNYKTYRAPVSERKYTVKTGTLKDSLRDDFQAERYFQYNSNSKFAEDNKDNYLVTYLNREEISKRIIKVQKIFKGASKNDDTLLRINAFRELTKVNLKGGGFVVNMLRGQVKKDIQKAIRREGNVTAKNYLKKLLQNM